MNNRPRVLSATFVKNVNVPGRYGDGRGGLGLSLRAFIDALVETRNAGRTARLAEERAVLGALPARALPAHRDLDVTVKRWGIIRVANKPYTLPSRLIGHRVRVRLYADHLDVYYHGELVARPDRVQPTAPQPAPEVCVRTPDLGAYDRLLEGPEVRT